MSDAELVKQFTEETGNIIPSIPSLMTKDETYFLIKMMLDEIMERAATVADPDDAKKAMIEMITHSKDIPKETGVETELIASQADALIDCYYYSLNAAAKKGVNLSKVFKVVHQANMNKKIKGKFIKREDGKIMKPDGWTPPDIIAEIVSQTINGPFTGNHSTHFTI